MKPKSINIESHDYDDDQTPIIVSNTTNNHYGHLRRFGPKRLPHSQTNPALLSPDSNLVRLVRGDPSHMDETTKTDAVFFRSKIFPDMDELICTGANPMDMTTKRWRLSDVAKAPPSMVVPAYMTAREGLTSGYPSGTGIQKLSCRCAANTGDARFVVYCANELSLEDQAYRIIRLAREAPLVMVVMTAMGWLNAWYSVIGWSQRDVKRLRSRACRFDSWSKTRIACHPYPFPGGRHNYVSGYEGETPIVIWTGQVHRAVYFDPDVIGTTIPNSY